MTIFRLSQLFVFLAILCPSRGIGEETTFTQRENIVYAEAHGVGLVMDIFTPTGNKNGLAVIDVISGAWHSDRGKIRDHLRAQTFQILCRKGYTVFAIRPGSITKFSAPEMIDHLNQGIRWVKEHAKDYGIDPDRLGMMGASAGGHLASLAAVTADNVNAAAGQSGPAVNTRVKAVAVFFPPTDFLNYGKPGENAIGRGVLKNFRAPFDFHEFDNATKAFVPITDEERILTIGRSISPVNHVSNDDPPTLIIHGDADLLVPIQQAEIVLDKLKEAGVPTELVVKKGAAHGWPELGKDTAILADWFDKHLAKK
jgi:acetyl esterase/lipase